jgi:hypothetical protein
VSGNTSLIHLVLAHWTSGTAKPSHLAPPSRDWYDPLTLHCVAWCMSRTSLLIASSFGSRKSINKRTTLGSGGTCM